MDRLFIAGVHSCHRSQAPQFTRFPSLALPFFFCILMCSRKKKWCVWLLLKFFSSMKENIQLPLAQPPRKAVLPELFSCQHVCMFLGLRLILCFLSAEKIPLPLDAGWILAVFICVLCTPFLFPSFPSLTWICSAQGFSFIQLSYTSFPLSLCIAALGPYQSKPLYEDNKLSLVAVFSCQTQQLSLGCSHPPKGMRLPCPCSSCDSEAFLPSSPPSTHPIPPVPGG